MVDDLVPEGHSVYQLSMQTGQVEPVLSIVLGERRLSDEERRSFRQTEYDDIVGVFGHETLEISSVVSVKLSLCEGRGVEGSCVGIAHVYVSILSKWVVLSEVRFHLITEVFKDFPIAALVDGWSHVPVLGQTVAGAPFNQTCSSDRSGAVNGSVSNSI